jgi:uncharacterized lipoprotein YmbA
MKKILITLSALLLSACATPIPAKEMMPNPNVYSQLDHNGLTKNVSVGKITLSSEMPKVGFVVTEPEFSNTLKDALEKAGWLGSKNAKYSLSAHFVKFDQPFTLFNTKIFSVVDYTLTNTKTNQTVYNQNVQIPCVKGMGEVWDANLRQIETLKCAIREYVTHVLRDLNSKF